jgi:hypothetical protein
LVNSTLFRNAVSLIASAAPTMAGCINIQARACPCARRTEYISNDSNYS